MIDKLLDEAINRGLQVKEVTMPDKLKGLLLLDEILINTNLTRAEKIVALSEEIEHHKLNLGNIIDIRDINNNKQELLARWSTYEKLLPLELLIESVKSGVTNVYEFSEYCRLPEDFLVEAVNYYRQRYGYAINGNYLINFNGAIKVVKLNRGDYLDIKWKDMIGDIINVNDDKVKIKSTKEKLVKFNKEDVYQVNVNDVRMTIEFIDFQFQELGSIFIPNKNIKDAILIFNEYDKTGRIYEPKSINFIFKSFYQSDVVKQKRKNLQVPIPVPDEHIVEEDPVVIEVISTTEEVIAPTKKPKEVIRKLNTIVAGITKENNDGESIQKILKKYVKSVCWDEYEDLSNKEIIDFYSDESKVYQFRTSEVDTIKLVPEPDNTYDPNAIMVVHDKMGHIGYIPEKDTEKVRWCMKNYNNYDIYFETRGGDYKQVTYNDYGNPVVKKFQNHMYINLSIRDILI